MEIRVLTENDQIPMLKLLTNKRIRQTYMLPDFEAEEAAIPLFRRLLQLSREENHFVRGIQVQEALVGFLNDVEIKNGAIELGYVIHPAHQGKGYATAALTLAIDQLFRLGYQEVITGAFAENTASIRVMEKAGMLPMAKADEIEYRGKKHHCVYFHITPA